MPLSVFGCDVRHTRLARNSFHRIFFNCNTICSACKERRKCSNLGTPKSCVATRCPVPEFSGTVCFLKDSGACLFWLCTFVARWIVLWATHGLPSRASVYRGCPCRDPPMCLDAQCGVKAERQPFVVVGVWSCRCLLCALPNIFNVISLHCSCTCSVSNNNS